MGPTPSPTPFPTPFPLADPLADPKLAPTAGAYHFITCVHSSSCVPLISAAL
jgi:hypothetical protein